MGKRTSTRRVDKAEAVGYAETGRGFLQSARDLSELANEGAPYGNAIGLMSIHAAISYADALTIAFGEKKSADDHTQAVATLRSVMGSKLDSKAAKAFIQILQQKDTISYQGTFYPLAEGRKLLAKTETFCEWAKETFETRP